jgi:hypothetical protein
MSMTTVYGCDWCQEIVPKDNDGKPNFAARVTVESFSGFNLSGDPGGHDEADICGQCRLALKAVAQGKVKRG